VKPIRDRSTPLVYMITDRRVQTPDQELTSLIDLAARAAAAGVDMVQVRERDLSARDVFQLAEAISTAIRGTETRVLINDRADIAACAGAGVHLTTRSLTPGVVREAFGPDLLVGASTHTIEEAEAAERDGADFVVFGPVFETASKKEYGEPVGLEALGHAAARLRIPVLALGGINISNFARALDSGAAGVAGISIFSETDLNRLVTAIKSADARKPGYGQS
jgi:thiamine-phosphate pyrophosphorylase